MRATPELALHQHDLAHGPFDRLDALLGHAMAIVQQRDVRCERTRLARLSVQGVAQPLLQDIEALKREIAQLQRLFLTHQDALEKKGLIPPAQP